MKKIKISTLIDLTLAGVVIVWFFNKYYDTLAPGLLTGDSAEFQVMSHQLGLTHAMGYPLYLLIGKLFSWLPMNELPWRINLLSVVFACLALGAMYFTARLLTENKMIALAASVALGYTGIFWINSIIAEVYSSSVLVSIAIIFLVLLWSKYRDQRALFLAGMLGGMGLGFHSMIVLLAPAVVVYLLVYKASRKEWIWAMLGTAAGLVILFSAYYWLAVRNPATSDIQSVIIPNLSRYGLTVSDLDNPLERIIFTVSARQFSGSLFSVPFNDVVSHIGFHIKMLFLSTGILWVSLALGGLIACFIPGRGRIPRWREGILFGLSLLVLVILPANYSIRVGIVVFYIASFIPVAFLAITGLDTIISLVIQLMAAIKVRLGTLTQTLMQLTVGLVLLGLILINFTTILDMGNKQPREPVKNSLEVTYADIMWIYYFTSRDWAEDIVALVEDDSIIFTEWKILYGIYYVGVVQKEKPGITVIETTPYPGGEALVESEMALIEEQYGKRPIYFTHVIHKLDGEYDFIKLRPGVSLYRLERK